jgi:hypothetical protein
MLFLQNQSKVDSFEVKFQKPDEKTEADLM